MARFLAVALCIALAACTSSNTNPSPTPSPSPQISNLSGDYTGTVQDAQSGSGTVAGTLAQQGSNAGGSFVITRTGGTDTGAISLAITASNAVSGSLVIDYANGTTCTFTTTGTYSNNGTIATLNGSYTAVTNCAGDTGTYALTQQCADTVSAADRRPMSYPPHC